MHSILRHGPVQMAEHSKATREQHPGSCVRRDKAVALMSTFFPCGMMNRAPEGGSATEITQHSKQQYLSACHDKQRQPQELNVMPELCSPIKSQSRLLLWSVSFVTLHYCLTQVGSGCILKLSCKPKKSAKYSSAKCSSAHTCMTLLLLFPVNLLSPGCHTLLLLELNLDSSSMISYLHTFSLNTQRTAAAVLYILPCL